MAVSATLTIVKGYDNVSGNKRETGGTFAIAASGSYDATAVTYTHNQLGLKQVEWFDVIGGNGTGNDSDPIIGVTLTSTGVSIRFYGTRAASVLPLTELSSGTPAATTWQWRARGY